MHVQILEVQGGWTVSWNNGTDNHTRFFSIEYGKADLALFIESLL